MGMDITLIRDMTRAERPRDRLLQLGVEALKTEELLALILRTGYTGHGAVEVARSILTAYPLNQLLEMSAKNLAKLRGMASVEQAHFSPALNWLAGQDD